MKNENRVSDVVGDVQIAGSRIERNRVRPIQLSLFTLNDAQRFDVAVRVERIDRNRRKFETAGPCNKVVADGTPVGDEDELSVYIDRNAVNIAQSRFFTFDDAQRCFVSGGAFAIYHHPRRVLDRDKKLLLTFVHCKRVSAMRSLQYARRFDISKRVVSEHDDLVAGVRFDRVDLPVIGVDVDAVVELDLSFQSLNHSLRLGDRRAGRSVGGALENPYCPEVIVLKNNFIELRVDGDVTVCGILVPNHPGRLTAHFDRRRIRCVSSPASSLLSHRREQVPRRVLLERSHQNRIGRSRRGPSAHFSIGRQLLNGNQLRSACAGFRRKLQSLKVG